MVKCKACNSDMELEEIEGYPGQYQTVCGECHRKTHAAMQVGEWDYEGLWWDKHLSAIDPEHLDFFNDKTRTLA